MHTTGGYIVGVSPHIECVFDMKEDDVFWCTADIGWVTGHSYIVYGPLSNGMTTVMYEGTPDFPIEDRFWGMIEKYGVTFFIPRRRRFARSCAGAGISRQSTNCRRCG